MTLSSLPPGSTSVTIQVHPSVPLGSATQTSLLLLSAKDTFWMSPAGDFRYKWYPSAASEDLGQFSFHPRRAHPRRHLPSPGRGRNRPARPAEVSDPGGLAPDPARPDEAYGHLVR